MYKFFLLFVLLATLGCAAKKQVYVPPPTPPAVYVVSMYEKVININRIPHRVICIQVTDTNRNEFYTMSGHYFIQICDSAHCFEVFWAMPNGEGRFEGHFAKDDFESFSGPVAILFGYSHTPWVVFKNVDLKKALIPLDTVKYDATAPVYTRPPLK